mgnify:CR=1 FL=1
MNMNITIFDNYSSSNKKINFDYEKIVNDFLNYQEFKEEKTEISLIFVDNEEIKKINNEYRHKDYATDVISFENNEDEYDINEDDNKYLGDIFISIDKVNEQALLYGHSVDREFAFLLCHGILHLHGYDHMEEDEEKIMFDKQDKILNDLNYKR